MMKKFLSVCIAVLMTACVLLPFSAAAAEAGYSRLENVAVGASIIGTPGEGTGAALTGETFSLENYAAGMGIDLVLDMSTAKAIKRISVYTRQDAATGDEIEITASETGDSYVSVGATSDSATKTVIHTDPYGVGLVRHDFALSGNYRYVKLCRSADKSWVHIAGLAVYAETEAAEVPANGNVALNKTVSGTHSNASVLVDGDETTAVELTGNLESVIDLGGSYPLDGIRLCGRTDSADYRTGNSISVELSPTAYFDSDEILTVVPSQNLNGGDHIYSLADKTKTYRYIRLKSAYLYMPEIAAYVARDTQAGSAQGNLAYRKPVFGAGGLHDSIYGTVSSLTEPATGLCESYAALYGYAQIDLLNSYDIGKVEVLYRNTTEMSGWQIVASNDFAFESATVLGTLTAAQSDSTKWVIDIPETANYRYIRLAKTDRQYGVACGVAVYAKGQKAQIAFAKINETPSDPKYSIERFDSVTLTPGYGLANSLLIAVTYDKGGNRIGFKTVQLADDGYNPDSYGAENFTVTFDWSVACPQEGGTVRVFVWNNLTGLQPVTASFDGTVCPQK